MQLVYFSPVPWASFRQRPHEFVDWFHLRFQRPVLWVEPYPARLPRWQDLSRPAARMPQASAAPSWLRVVRPFSIPAEPLAVGRVVNRLLFWPSVLRRIRRFTEGQRTLLAIGKPSDLALVALKQLPHLTSLYDAMDDFPAFHDGIARIACARIESEVIRRVTMRSTSSSHIARRMSDAAGASVSLIPNGVATTRLPVFRRRRDSGEQRSFGYVGTIGPWFDWSWIAKLAQDWPERRVEIHGPVYQAPPANLPVNVTLGPPLPHDQAIACMAEFGAGLIPFRSNELTDSVDPVKFYEYRGLGLPVISAPFGEMRQHGTQPRVLLADDPAAMHDRIAALLAEHDTAESVADFRRRNDWSARFEPLAEALDTMP